MSIIAVFYLACFFRANQHLAVRISVFVLFVTLSFRVSYHTDIKKTLVPAVMTALSILAEFVINLILYTGNTDNMEGSNHLEARKIGPTTSDIC